MNKQFGLANPRQTDLTTFDCSLNNLLTHSLILAASCFLPSFSCASASQRSILIVTVRQLVISIV